MESIQIVEYVRISGATATGDGVTLIAVVMGAETKEIRNSEAMKLLDYGFAQCRPYVDTEVVPEDLQIPGQNGTCNTAQHRPHPLPVSVLSDFRRRSPVFQSDPGSSLQA